MSDQESLLARIERAERESRCLKMAVAAMVLAAFALVGLGAAKSVGSYKTIRARSLALVDRNGEEIGHLDPAAASMPGLALSSDGRDGVYISADAGASLTLLARDASVSASLHAAEGEAKLAILTPFKGGRRANAVATSSLSSFGIGSEPDHDTLKLSCAKGAVSIGLFGSGSSPLWSAELLEGAGSCMRMHSEGGKPRASVTAGGGVASLRLLGVDGGPRLLLEGPVDPSLTLFGKSSTKPLVKLGVSHDAGSVSARTQKGLEEHLLPGDGEVAPVPKAKDGRSSAESDARML